MNRRVVIALSCLAVSCSLFFLAEHHSALAVDGLLARHAACRGCGSTTCTHPIADTGWAGEWHWMRSPEQERRVVVALYNRYCVRCHGVDGKGVWDIPDVPDFTNPRWQACRTDAQIVRLTIEGRGACMPAFRGTLSLEETWALARHLRTFSGTPESRDK